MKHPGGNVRPTRGGLRRETSPGDTDNNEDLGGRDESPGEKEKREERGPGPRVGGVPLVASCSPSFFRQLL